MEKEHLRKIAAETNLTHEKIKATIELLDEGATIPFIARYRKEITGSMDEVQIMTISAVKAAITNIRYIIFFFIE